MGQRAAIYCRVSTADQSCARQEHDLSAFAVRAGYEVVGIYKETGSGVKLDRAERKKVMALAQARQIDVVLVTELSRWGRSTLDLLHTLKELEARRVSMITMNSLTFDPASPPLGREDVASAASRVSGRNPTASLQRCSPSSPKDGATASSAGSSASARTQ
jgi:DNA invertase Pin-like site-specific DNA recombinase